MRTELNERLRNIRNAQNKKWSNRPNTISFLIFILPYFTIFLIYYIFDSQTKKLYKQCYFSVDVPLLFSKDFEKTNFDCYIINKNSKTDLIYFHGSRIKKEIHFEIVNKLSEETRFNIIVPFYRGYGTSKGRTTETNLKTDLHILSYLLNIRNTKQIIFGQSLGAAISIYYANINQIDKIVLENPFYSMKHVVLDFFFRKIFVFLLTEKWASFEIIGNLESKILFLVSRKDQIIENKHSNMLADKCKNKEIVYLENAHHFNGYKVENDFYKIIGDFFRK
ncbi:bem46 protein [Gurleya vavrai]